MGYIRTANLGKAYKRYPSKGALLLEWLGVRAEAHEKRWVLRHVDFEVQPGESVGIVGQNGAGKSTLLKMIVGTTQPTEGSVEVRGRVAALLELGMGFHPDFTGRQNCFVAGQLMGMSAAEIETLLPEIEAFAGVGDYMGQPLRSYSSGMHVRLAFAVATCRRPDILIVDEALSVGDLLFQQKSFQRIKQFCQEGTTLLFVSHSPSTVFALCSRAILLNEGGLVIDATPREVIALYETLMLAKAGRVPPGTTEGRLASKTEKLVAPGAAANANRSRDSEANAAAARSQPAATATETNADGLATTNDHLADIRTEAVEHVDVGVLNREGRATASVISGQEITLEIAVRFADACGDPHVGFRLHNRLGEPLFATTTWGMGRTIGPVAANENVRVRFTFSLALYPGEYSFTVGVAEGAMTDGWFARDLYRAFHVRTVTVLQDVRNSQWVGTWNVDPEVSVDRAPAGSTRVSDSTA